MSAGAASTLKCVTAWSEARNLCDLVSEALRRMAGDDEVIAAGEDVCLVYTSAEPAAIRDRVAGVLQNGESVLVVEFERWSGLGPGIDSGWLSRRGH